jgi:hypothetical protein
LIGIHAAESLETTKKSITVTGKSEVQRIVSKLLPNFVVHLTHASDMDIELVARKKLELLFVLEQTALLVLEYQEFPRC